MDSVLFQRLLQEGEGVTLDFKRDQYKFVKATDEERSELVKDVLGFANAFRRSEAYILIGVEEKKGEAAEVVGIPEADQLADHTLQQFFYHLTNRPIRFQYEAFGYEGKQVGVLRIDECPRPIFLKKDFGKLKKDEVYIRRGSSTDPSRPAGTDDIVMMGIETHTPAARLSVEFARGKDGPPLGAMWAWSCELCEMPKYSDIPNHGRPSTGNQIADLMQSVTGPALNPDYFRELAVYETVRRLFRPVVFTVCNEGRGVAENVRVELTFAPGKLWRAIRWNAWPKTPRLHQDYMPYLGGSLVDRINAARQPPPGQVSIVDDGGSVVGDMMQGRVGSKRAVRLDIEFGTIQPGRRMWSDAVYLGAAANGPMEIDGKVYADNLPEPHEFQLVLGVLLTKRTYSFEDLQEMPVPNRDE